MSNICFSCNKKCPLVLGCNVCMKPSLYCSEKCKAIGWAKHQDEQCKNVIEVPHKTVNLFVPYFAEDLMDKSSLKDFPNTGEPYQSYITQFNDTKGVVYQRCIASLLLDAPTQKSKENPKEIQQDYTINIEYLDDTMEPLLSFEIPNQSTEHTLISKDSMYKQNKLLADYISHEDGYVLWSKKQDIELPKEGGILKFTINDNLAPMIGLYMFDFVDDNESSWKSKQRKTPLQKINQIKYNTNGFVPSTLETYRLSDDVTGNQLKLTFDVPKDKDTVKLVDIEYYINEQTFEPNHPINSQLESDDHFFNIIKFSTDATNLEQVTGLVAALSDRIADGTLTGNHITKQFNIINSYCDQLQQGTITEPSASINAAIQQATNALWENIGRMDWQKRLKKRWFNTRKSLGTAGKSVIARTADMKTVEAMIINTITNAEKFQSKKIREESGQLVSRAENALEAYKERFLREGGKDGYGSVDTEGNNPERTTRLAFYDKWYDRLKGIQAAEKEIRNAKKIQKSKGVTPNTEYSDQETKLIKTLRDAGVTGLPINYY